MDKILWEENRIKNQLYIEQNEGLSKQWHTCFDKKDNIKGKK